MSNTRLTRLVHDTVDMWLDSMPGAVGTEVTMLDVDPPEGVEFDRNHQCDSRYMRIDGKWLKVSVEEQL